DLPVTRGELPHPVRRGRVGGPGLVRMHAGRAPDALPAFGERECFQRILGRGGDGDEARDAGFGGSAKRRLPVFPEGGVGHVTVAIEISRHTVAGWGRSFFSPSLPTPHRRWISMSAGDATKIDE